MLILSRRESESVHLGDDIVLTIVRVSGEKVRIGIQAPSHIKVLRNELEIEIEDSATPKIATPHSPANTQKPKVATPKTPANTQKRPAPIQVRRAA